VEEELGEPPSELQPARSAVTTTAVFLAHLSMAGTVRTRDESAMRTGARTRSAWIARVRAVDNAEYGIFRSHALSGRLDRSSTSGANAVFAVDLAWAGTDNSWSGDRAGTTFPASLPACP